MAVVECMVLAGTAVECMVLAVTAVECMVLAVVSVANLPIDNYMTVLLQL